MGPAVLSIPGIDDHSTHTFILDSCVRHICGIFASGSVDQSKKAALAELVLAAFLGVDSSVQSKAWSETLSFLVEGMEQSNEDWESCVDVMSCMLLELEKQDASEYHLTIHVHLTSTGLCAPCKFLRLHHCSNVDHDVDLSEQKQALNYRLIDFVSCLLFGKLT